jgi:hypothetical protein
LPIDDCRLPIQEKGVRLYDRTTVQAFGRSAVPHSAAAVCRPRFIAGGQAPSALRPIGNLQSGMVQARALSLWRNNGRMRSTVSWRSIAWSGFIRSPWGPGRPS